ncbi:aminopeptidase P family protein [Neofamilia massiliensis]|uniref:aminopeptidase P family protein n=1 Tax=Neofamilia massiliensis TaxID=1673724 RepID=UPI0006BB895A|nr:aminopeptidase P family protein [Neofamilia massiliensis]
MDVNQKLGMLRNLMAEYRLDAYVVSNSDPHFSEYLPDRYRQIKWLTNFSGSNALVLVTNDQALIWTDGRYFVQCQKEIAGSDFEMMKMATPGYPNIFKTIEKLLPEGRRLGVDRNILSQSDYESYEKICKNRGIDLVDDYDLITELWTDRPEIKKDPAFIHELKYTGLSAKEKINDLREKFDEEEVDGTIISSLADIAWLYNLRGSDIANNPVVTAYAYVDKKSAILFIEEEKLSMEVLDHLKENDIDYLKYSEVFAKANNLRNMTLALDKKTTARSIFKVLDPSVKVKDITDLTTKLKAIKNDVEIKNQKHAYIKDGVALTKFIYWLKHHENIESEDEYTVGEKLEEFRKAQDLYVEPSFSTISAYKENAAMMHYKAEKDSAKKLEKEGFLLVDSGGQYYDGTTDTTRTIVLGKLTDEEKKDFTLTLKGHMDLMTTIFLAGTTGFALDAICRRPLWQNKSDYKCGTGHGVGYFLGVHEGPQGISPRSAGAAIEPGMVVTIEPGVYKEGKHGIRTENVVLVVEDGETLDGKFLKFECMSFVPIDLEAIDPSLLNDLDKKIINDYHKEVYEKISKYLTREESDWLKEVTKAI